MMRLVERGCGVRTLARPGLAAVAAAMLWASPSAAQRAGDPGVELLHVAPGYYRLSAGTTENLLVYAGESESLVIGVQAPALVARARVLLDSLGAPPVRHAVMLDGHGAPVYGDGGWGRAGAATLAHERLILQMRRLLRDSDDSGSASPIHHDMPGTGFSAVVQLYTMAPEEVHLVYKSPGYTQADVIVHFEEEGIVYLSNMFTMDGYPIIDVQRGGDVSGLIRHLSFFTQGFHAHKIEPIVPGRGPLATTEDLRAYVGMLTTVRDRVQALIEGGATEAAAVAANPTEDLNERWGSGPVPPGEFVRMVYRSLKK